MVHEIYDNHNINFSKSDHSIHIIEGWPIKKFVKLCNGTSSQLNDYSDNGKLIVCSKLWNFIDENGLHKSMINTLKSNSEYTILTKEEWSTALQKSTVSGAKSQQEYLQNETIGYSNRNRGFYLPQNGQEKLRKGIELENIEQYQYRISKQKPELKKVPKYFTDSVKSLVVEVFEKKLENTSFSKLNKSELARTIAEQLNDSDDISKKMKCALNSKKGGFLVSIIYGSEKHIDLKNLFTERCKRAYKKGPSGISIHNVTQKQKNKKIRDSLIYGLKLSDSEINTLAKNDSIYVGDFSQDENGNYTLMRDIRSIFGQLLLKLYKLGGFSIKEGDLKVKYLHWGDGSKLLGSGFFLAAVLIDYVSSGIFDLENKQVISVLKNWLPYFMSFQQENKENMEDFMLKRKEIMERLTEPFRITEKLTVTFELEDYVGDLSHFWKIFQIINSFCAHCQSKYPKSKFIQEKLKLRRKICSLIIDSMNSKNGVGSSFQNLIGEYEKKCNPGTCCDVLHTIKGCIEEILSLLENYDGVDHEIITDLQKEVLKKGDVSMISGGNTRVFLLSYQQWLPLLSDKLLENSVISERRKQIYERFEYGKKNLEWILFLMSLICKMVYRSDNNKQPHEVACIETITYLLYVALRSRYGDEFMTKHFHGLLIHFPQDFETKFQRLCSCERGEFLISVLKRVSLTESNRNQDNALLAMVLSVSAHLQRLLDGEKELNVDTSKIFNQFQFMECNFKITGDIFKSKYLSDISWFLEYLKETNLEQFVKIERIDEKNFSSIDFCFSNEWKYCELDINSLIYNVETAPKVNAAENNSNRETCSCGKPCNQNCSSGTVKYCKQCCIINQYRDENQHHACKIHKMNEDEIIEKYLENEIEGMTAVNTKKARGKKLQGQLNIIAARLNSERTKRKRKDIEKEKRKKSKTQHESENDSMNDDQIEEIEIEQCDDDGEISNSNSQSNNSQESNILLKNGEKTSTTIDSNSTIKQNTNQLETSKPNNRRSRKRTK